MDSIEQRLKAWAAKAGFRIMNIHDGLCDFQNLHTGMMFWDDPLDDALEYFKWPERYAVEIDALFCSVDLEHFDALGVFTCRDEHRTRRRVCLLHTKAPCPVPWALKTPDGTRSFHDLHSALEFLCGVYGQERSLTPKQYDAVMRAYHEYEKSGNPFAMPEI